MSDTNSPPPSRPANAGVKKVALTVLACAVIFAAAGGTLVAIQTTEPKAQRGGATRKSAALVETFQVSRGSYRPELVVLGRIEAARDIVLSPRVEGQVLEIGEAFAPGGVVAKGDVLVRIDPADFETALAIEEAALHQATAELRLERGRQSVAEQELELLDQRIDDANRELVLRVPQLESRKAAVESAEAAVRRARLDLERARIAAPFDAQVLTRAVNVGSQVAPGQPLARLVGTAEYWVIATVPVRQLRMLRFADDHGEGSAVRIEDPARWGEGVYREGRLTRLIGDVDERTRLARVVVSVPDPLTRGSDQPRLILGGYVDTRIRGEAIDGVVRLPREYVRARDTVWVLDDGRLAIRDAEVVFRDAAHAYIRAGLDDGDRVVTTSLATVADGLPLRAADEPGGEAQRDQPQRSEPSPEARSEGGGT